jgi:hypothetical protein
MQNGRSDWLMPIMGGYRSQATISWDLTFQANGRILDSLYVKKKDFLDFTVSKKNEGIGIQTVSFTVLILVHVC